MEELPTFTLGNFGTKKIMVIIITLVRILSIRKSFIGLPHKRNKRKRIITSDTKLLSRITCLE